MKIPETSAILLFIETLSAKLAKTVFQTVPIFGQDVSIIVLWLFAGMLVFSFWLHFPNLRGLPIAVRTLRGDFAPAHASGQMSSFQALSTALSGTVGLGNIAGVAIAIAMGGPGAAFWIVAIGFFAMNLKFAEVAIAVRFRREDRDGTVFGGPMYYLRGGLSSEGFPRLGRVLAGIYAFLALFACLQVFQVNQSYSQVSDVLALAQRPWAGVIYGTVLGVLAGFVLLGGARRVAAATSRLLPLMCIGYILSCCVVLVANASAIPDALITIVHSAFSQDAVAGGIFGSFVIGMRRAVYSNEAGIGSATMAHAVVKTDEPVSEGYVALFEPLVDTVFICSLTALVIVVTDVWRGDYTDIAMTAAAFSTVSSGFSIALAIAVVLFCFSTVLAAGFYARQVCAYLFNGNKTAWHCYLFVYCSVLPIGAVANLTALVNIVDSFFFLLSMPNLVGLYILMRRIKRDKIAFDAKIKAEESET